MNVNSGDLLESVLYGRYVTGHETRSVFHYQVASDAATVVERGDITNWMAWWFSQVAGNVGTKFEFYQLQLTNLTIWDNEVFIFDPPYAGTSVSELLPYQSAALITMYTNQKKRLGKKYLPGYVEAAQTGSFLSPTAYDNLSIVADIFRSGITLTAGGVLLPVLYSSRDGVISYVKSAVAREIMATQRRRKPGVGI